MATPGRATTSSDSGQGADILVHEVIDLERASASGSPQLPNYERVRAQLARSHTSYEAVGGIAARAGVGTLVLSHVVPGDSEPSEEAWEARVRPTTSTDLLCGVDLDELALSR